MLHRPAQAHGRTATIGDTAIPEDRDATDEEGPCSVRSLVGTIQGGQRAQVQAPRLSIPATRCISNRATSRAPRRGSGAASSALAEMQDRLYAQDRWAVLLIFQAMDAAGKDGAIKHVMSGVNPQGCQVYVVQGAVGRGARPRFPVALHRSACPSAAASASSTAPITRRCWSCACTRAPPAAEAARPSSSRKNIWKQRYEDIRNFERYLDAQRHARSASSSCTCRARSRRSAFSSASTTRRRTGSSRLATCASAATGTST